MLRRSTIRILVTAARIWSVPSRSISQAPRHAHQFVAQTFLSQTRSKFYSEQARFLKSQNWSFHRRASPRNYQHNRPSQKNQRSPQSSKHPDEPIFARLVGLFVPAFVATGLFTWAILIMGDRRRKEEYMFYVCFEEENAFDREEENVVDGEELMQD